MRKKLAALTLAASISTGVFGTSAQAASPFEDISEDFWGYDDVTALTEQAIINGYPDDTYRPNQSLTRAQSAMIIGRALDVDLEAPSMHQFSDIHSDTSGAITFIP
ncbi:S-layer homology domain-containing protein [Alteribacillus sp. JSM 102045]|uniref:S-layer homology domain-containing protein n=1 Tax=Alteribacillus sp. JSM 102045 TaxID=1562101 RepID=UPI0035C11B25